MGVRRHGHPLTPKRRLVLASASPARLRLLREAGFDPEPIVSGVDEEAFEVSTPDELVEALAVEKANAVARRPEVLATGAVVIGCDSVLDVDGEVHGKPGSVEVARERLLRLRGRSAVLRTGHCVIDTAERRWGSEVASTEVRFGLYDDEELEAYLRTGEPLAVAGSFTLDGYSAPFVDGVVGDPSNVIGLSLPVLRRLLRSISIRIEDLWV